MAVRLKFIQFPARDRPLRVYLPILSQADNGAVRMLKHSVLPGGKERILFIDDEPSLADIGHKTLSRLGYRVRTCTSSLEAVDAFSSEPQAYDLVITDQTMPHLTGLDLVARMLEIRPDIPIILCTGYSQQVTPEKSPGKRHKTPAPETPDNSRGGPGRARGSGCGRIISKIRLFFIRPGQ